ncbi:MAG: adenylate/guanylate cyclase domain-containing protein [Kiloniellales bacterium]|nr:adenylate/guanylate cyclase domain-containing protein [Kiloniellales bacterium]
MERRLAAILALDVVGYSRLMGVDEQGTLAAFKVHRSELVDPKIAENRGRVVKSTGDGVLAEFSSVVDAVGCAVQIQQSMLERNALVPEERQIVFRIGINLGDIIVEDGDIHGDGVNVAVRLEGLADPGGICVSRSVRNQVRDKVTHKFEDLGEIKAKNIARPLRVFRVVLNGVSAENARKARGSGTRVALAFATAAMLVFTGSIVAWLQPWAPKVEPASVQRMAYPLPDKPSIAVLAFENLRGGPQQDHLSDGISDSIITTLAKVPDLFVIARNSSFTYKGKTTELRSVAEELGVRYILEGTLQTQDEKIRVTAQLIDALTGEYLWAEIYDRGITEILSLQDDISKHVATALQINLTLGETATLYSGSTNSPRAWKYHAEARSIFLRLTPEDNAKAQRMLEQALTFDPKYTSALVTLGWTYRNQARFRWNSDPTMSYARAVELAKEALAQDAGYSDAYVLLGDVIANRDRDYAKAIPLIKKAISLHPGVSGHQGMLGFHLILAGRPKEAIPHLKIAMRLSPFYAVWLPNMLGRAYQLIGENEKAIAAFKEVLERVSIGLDASSAHAWLALAHAEEGREASARRHMESALEINPTASVKQYRRRFDFEEPALLQRRIEIWRRLGLPE